MKGLINSIYNPFNATNAILDINIPINSNVLLSKNNIILLPTFTILSDDITWMHVIFLIVPNLLDEENTWTITATRNNISITKNIILDSVKYYSITMYYTVPKPYQEVTYLQSSGTQYINTNYIITANDRVEIFGQLLAHFNDNNFCEVTQSSGGVRFLILEDGSHLRFVNGSGTNPTSGTVSLNTDYCMIVSTAEGFIINNSKVGAATVRSGLSRPLYLFAGNDIGTVTRYGKVRIKYVKISTSGTPQRSYYACYRKSDSVAGLWDDVNKTFLTNAGSGTFVVGSDVI